MVKAMVCGIIVNDFEPSLSDKYPWERYEPPYPPSYGLNSTTSDLLEGWLLYLIIYKVDMSLNNEMKLALENLEYSFIARSTLARSGST